MILKMYVIVDAQGNANYWSIQSSADLAWEDYRAWYTEAVEGVYRACAEVPELKAAGLQCVEVELNGVVIP